MSRSQSFINYLVATVVFTSLLLLAEKSQASHSMGADLTYECVGANTYKVRLSFYRDCVGVAEPTNAQILVSSASCNQSFTMNCYKIPGTGQEITPLCPSAVSTCNGGIWTGVEEWIYEGTVVLPMQCTDWVFSFDLCCRNTAITNINAPGSDDFFIYSTLNNTISPCNNSPTFSNKPVPFVCIGQEFCFNHGANDSDGDSLVYSLITPLQDPGFPVVYSGSYSALQPLNSVPAMQFNSANGDICMTPQSLEITVMAVLVQEYRNGVLIGSVERDIQVTVINCSNTLPTMSGINGTSDITATICAGQQFCFDVLSNDVDGGQNLTVEYDQSIPGATFGSTSAQHPTGTFCWTPPASSISSQPYCFTLSVHDDACPYMGYQIYSYCLTVTGVVADAGIDQSVGCSGTVNLNANGSGGNPPYAFLWSTGSSATSITVGPGTYTLTVSDNFCSNEDIVNVTILPSPVIASIPVTDVLCNGGSDGTITVNANGGTGAIQYSIDNGATYQASNVFSGLPIGNYSITIQDVNGCTGSAPATIAQPPLLEANPSSISATCTNSNGSITIASSGGTGTIQYSIDNGATYQLSNVFNGLVTGNYAVMILDANGCTASSNINVPDQPPPSISATPVNDVTCNAGNNGSITVNAVGGTGTIQYSIDNGATYQASNIFPGLIAGNYQVIIQDANGCTATAPAVIAEPTPVVVNASSVTATCTNSNGSITITANGGTGTIQYSIDNGTSYQASNIFNSLATGNYSILVQDANGCTATSNINVPDEPSPTITATPVIDVTCNTGNNGSIEVNTNGGTGTIQYSIDNGSTYQPGNLFSGLTAGNYQITIQDANGCTAIAPASITEPPALEVNPSSTNSTCTNSNGSITITANGGTGTIQYSIDNGGTYQPSNIFNGLATGNYDVMVQDANGCTAIAAINVPDEPSPLITTTPVIDVTCNTGSDGSFSVNTSGGTGTIEFSIDNGASYQASNNFSGLPLGNYQVIIQDANGCTATAPVSISEPPPLVINPSSVTATCTASNGSITIVANGGTGIIEFSIDNGAAYQSSGNFINLSTGNYDIMVMDANGCTGVSMINVPDEPSPTITTTPVTDVTCNSGNDGVIDVTTNGGTGTIQYSLDNGGTYQPGNQFNGLPAGNYQVTIQDVNGCTATAPATISEPPALVINPSSQNSTCSDNNGSVSIVANGGTGVLQYSINNGSTYQSSDVFNGLLSGNYDVMVQDANGCTAADVIFVQDEPSPTISSTPETDATCFEGSNGSFLVNTTGGTGSIQFSLDNGVTYQSANNFSGLTAGNYQVTIQDANGCTAIANVIIEEPTEILLNTNTVSATCNGSNGSVTVTGNGGTGTLEFSIDNGQSFQLANTFNGLPAGNYDIIAQDANGCQSNTNAAVSNALAPVISSIQQDDITCNAGLDGSITINAIGGTGALGFSIDNGSTFQSSNNFTSLPAGNYAIVVQDANGCIVSSGVQLTEPDAVQFTATPVLSTCDDNNGSIEINGSGGIGTLQYSINGGNTFQASAIFNNLYAGNYAITVQDANGCSESSNAVVPGAPSPSIASTPVNDVNCFNGSDGSITINSNGGSGNILFSIDNGVTYQSSNNFAGLTAGNYQISIIDTNGCIATANAIVAEPLELTFSAVTIDATCNGSNGSLTVNGSGGTGTLEYSKDGGTTFQSSSTFNGLIAGAYNIVVQDANGCSVTDAVAVSNALAPVINSVQLGNVSCNDGENGTITILANGGIGVLQFSIDNGVTYQSGNNFNNLEAGLYDVVVIDGNGCLTTTTAEITEPDAVVFIASSDTATCGNSNGSLSIVANGGTGMLEFSIDSGTTFISGNNFNNLASGIYNIVVQDANGCSSSGVANVINAPSPVIISVNSTNLTCFGSGNGTISILANSGTAPLQYSYNGGNTFQSTHTFNNLSAGNFSIIVQDANGCTATSSALITQPPPLVINSSTTQAICGNSNGSITLNVTGGNGNYQYSLDSGATFLLGSVFNNLLAGNFYIVVHDGAGCTTAATVTVNNAQAPVISGVTLSDVSCYGLSDGTISINANGGAGTLVYSINNGISYQPGNVFNNVPAGNYTVWVLDTNDCLIASTAIITQPPQILVSSTTIGSSCGNSDGSVTVIASGGMGTLQFSVDSGATMYTGNFFPNMGAGNYNIIVQDSTGCQVSGIASVNNINGPVISNTVASNLTCFGSDNGAITITASGGIGGLSYSIDNGFSFQAASSFDSLPGGMYSVVVVDGNNCIATDGIAVIEPDPVAFNTLVSDATCGNSNGVIEVYATGGTGNLQFSNNSGTIFQTISTFDNLQAGNYTIVVQDANGCSASNAADVLNLASPVIAPGALTNVSCFEGTDGAVSISISGGTLPILFQWSNGATTQNVSGIAAGNYTVTITDANSCSAVQSLSITQPTQLTATSIVDPVSCFAGNDGSIAINPAGGTAPYSYNWSCGATASIATNLHVGNYSVVIADSNGCTIAITDSVTSPTMLVLNSAHTDVNCFGNGNGTINLAVSGGIAPYNYSWSNGSTTPVISGLGGGVYAVTVTDFNNCISHQSTSVFEPSQLVLHVMGNDTICITQQAIISASASGGTAPYSFLWNNGNTLTSQVVSPVNTASYSVNVIDANGCTVAQQSVTIAVNPPLSVIASDDNHICFGQGTSISAVASGGNGGPYSYTWNNNAGNGSSSIVSPPSTTTYEVIVNDNCGTPPVSDMVTITVHPVPQVAFEPLPPKGCVPLVVQFDDNTVVENGSQYQWSFGDGYSDTLNQNPMHIYYEPGSFTVSLTVISPFGCENTLTQPNAITVYSLPVADFIPDPFKTSILNPLINFNNQSVDAVSWQWDFGDAYGGSIEQHPQHMYRDTGTYRISLYVLSQHGCADTSYEEVIIQGDFTLYIPNAFSPNGDGLNELFFPQGIGITQMQMLIFDRWGQKIFASESFENPWDGTNMYNNSICMQDVYIYTIKAVDLFNGSHNYTGRVTLLR